MCPSLITLQCLERGAPGLPLIATKERFHLFHGVLGFPVMSSFGNDIFLRMKQLMDHTPVVGTPISFTVDFAPGGRPEATNVSISSYAPIFGNGHSKIAPYWVWRSRRD